jgi:fructuronate reductase
MHLGLGNFFRAHECWYTEHAPDAAEWGIAAFTGTGSTRLPRDLNAQDGLYTLVNRGADRDRFEVLGSLSQAYPGSDADAWLRHFRSPDLAAVTITVTEAGYLRGANGGLDVARPEVQADIDSLRRAEPAAARTVAGRFVAGLAARRRVDAGPLALVPCDNTPGNGALAERVVRDLAALVDDGLADWMTDSLTVVTTTVDRITPRTTAADLRAVRDATGLDDRCPVVAEPFHEWVLSGTFPAGRPQWEDAGAIFTDDVTPYENRKLWLLNGAHSLLAYTGSIRGHTTVAEALSDDVCHSWLDDWWAIASAHLHSPAEEITRYRAALLDRFANPRMADRLERIAADGSQKLPIRIVPVLRAERSVGRLPAGATRVIAGWICTLRGQGAPVQDARADEVIRAATGPLVDAVPRVLDALDPELGADVDVVALVGQQVEELAGAGRIRK